MKIIFGRSFDQTHFPQFDATQIGAQFLGPQRLLRTLENHLGLSGYRNDIEYLRVEQYRQILGAYLELAADVFYARAFLADQFATAADMLDRRDELLMAGWDFSQGEDIPGRLAVFADLEALHQREDRLQLSYGFADRLVQVQRLAADISLPFTHLRCVEPERYLPQAYRNLFRSLEARGLQLAFIPEPTAMGTKTNLQRAQHLLVAEPTGDLQIDPNDPSLILLRGKRDSDLAIFVAELIRKNEDLRPVVLAPDHPQTLDNAFGQSGLPGLGIQAISLGRPPLQLLKLATTFLWHPLNPYEVLEFVSLPVQPIEDELAYRIARQISQYPGVQGDGWRQMIGQYFGELDARREAGHTDIDPDEVRANYRFWFERRRFDPGELAPKEEMIQIFDFLHRWARKRNEENEEETPPVFTLSENARQIRELLETVPETHLSKLELERLVRTIYQPVPIQFNQRQLGALPVIHQPHSLWAEVPQTLWWNFAEQEPDYFFSRWYQPEVAYLARNSCHLEGPRQKNEHLIWQRKQALLRTRRQLILVCPEVVEGQDMQPHPLYAFLEASLPNLAAVTFSIDDPADRQRLDTFFTLPETQTQPIRVLGQPRPFVRLGRPLRAPDRAEESITSLEALLYYPYQWMFRHVLQLRKSPILSVVPDSTLQGNLAHRLVEQLLQEPGVMDWDRNRLKTWVADRAMELFEEEGTVFLMYGKDPERISFIKKMQYATWDLLNLLRNNNWSIRAIESDLSGQFAETGLRGRADLVLQRGGELAVLDLKWRGKTRRRDLIRNMEDLQLVLYAYLLRPDLKAVHTGYYILESQSLLARNNQAFQEADPIAPDLDTVQTNKSILQRMQTTYRWRMGQLDAGLIEIRCADTSEILEESYGDQLDLLEMKKEDAPFDDYRVLINLIR